MAFLSPSETVSRETCETMHYLLLVVNIYFEQMVIDVWARYQKLSSHDFGFGVFLLFLR